MSLPSVAQASGLTVEFLSGLIRNDLLQVYYDNDRPRIDIVEFNELTAHTHFQLFADKNGEYKKYG
ncbi:MAG: hypothetical protein H7A51_01455 [Akkermansiaceae bacterium]|nr:hypothetical protein [Akkermansiaceae bacterium]